MDDLRNLLLLDSVVESSCFFFWHRIFPRIFQFNFLINNTPRIIGQNNPTKGNSLPRNPGSTVSETLRQFRSRKPLIAASKLRRRHIQNPCTIQILIARTLRCHQRRKLLITTSQLNRRNTGIPVAENMTRQRPLNATIP